MRTITLLFFLAFGCLACAQKYEKLNGPYGGGSKVYEGNNGVLFQLNASRTELYKSTDGGNNWNPHPYPKPAGFRSVSIGGDGDIVLVSGGELYRSSNDGVSWSLINLPIGELVFYGQTLKNGALVISTNSGPYYSLDNGSTWTLSNLKYPVSYFFNSKNDQWIYAMTDRIVYLSKNSGMTWDTLFGTLFQGGRFNVLENQKSEILISAQDYIWKVDTTGKLLLRTSLHYNTKAIVEMAITTTGKMFAQEEGTLYLSIDDGLNWTIINSNFSIYTDISVSSTGILFARQTHTGSLYDSIDEGRNWKFAAYGLSNAGILEMDFINEEEILVLTYDGLFFSPDGGNHWKLLLQSTDFYSAPQQNKVQVIDKSIFLSVSDKYYFFNDPESPPSSNKFPNNNTLANYDFNVNPITKTLYLFDYDEVFRSIDFGKNWQKLNLSGALNMYCFSSGDVIAFSGNTIFKSNDDGLNWFPTQNTLSNISRISNMVGYESYSARFMCVKETDFTMYETHDEGESWSAKFIGNIQNVFYNQLIKSNNIGKSFLPSDNSQIFSSDPNSEFFTLFDDFNNYINGSINTLEISPNQFLFVGTNYEGLYKLIAATSTRKVLKGKVYSDKNMNCLHETGEGHLSKILIKAKNQSGTEFFSYTNQNGQFLLPLDKGLIDISSAFKNNYWTSCLETIDGDTYDTKNELSLGVNTTILCPFLEVDIQTDRLRRCFENKLVLSYYNSGTAMASDAFIEVVLDTFMDYRSSSIPVSLQTGKILRFNIGEVEVDERGQIYISVILSCNAKLGDVHCVEAYIYPDSLCIPIASAQVQTSAKCLGDSIQLIIENIGSRAMSTPRNWWAIDVTNSSINMDVYDSGSFFLNSGQVYSKKILSRNHVEFRAEQDKIYPNSAASKTEIISCSTNPPIGHPTLRITNLDEEGPTVSKFCLQNTGSFDPNDITGFPLGLTDHKYIEIDQELEYIIRFQNTGTDTAFTVRIENQVRKEQLDLSTFIPGASSHPYHYLITPEGKLIFSFNNIQLPDSNINEKASQGFVQYRIKPAALLSKNTIVYNDATIFFDFNEGVKTNLEFHTLGFPDLVNNKNKNQKYNELLLSPNPADTEVQIKLNQPLTQPPSYLIIYNEAFQITTEQKLSGILKPIQITNFIPGIYYLVLKDNSGQIHGIGKLIKK